MSILSLFFLIVIAGLCMWMVNTYIPMAPMIKSLLNFLVFVILLIYVLQFFGIINAVLPPPGFLKSLLKT